MKGTGNTRVKCTCSCDGSWNRKAKRVSRLICNKEHKEVKKCTSCFEVICIHAEMPYTGSFGLARCIPIAGLLRMLAQHNLRVHMLDILTCTIKQ